MTDDVQHNVFEGSIPNISSLPNIATGIPVIVPGPDVNLLVGSADIRGDVATITLHEGAGDELIGLIRGGQVNALSLGPVELDNSPMTPEFEVHTEFVPVTEDANEGLHADIREKYRSE